MSASSLFIFAFALTVAAGVTAAAAAPMRGLAAVTAPRDGSIVLAKRVRPAPADDEASTASGDLPGRYAVMREKRDTGCMVTLDRTRAKGGARAQLAPGCRDQGIVIFDPLAWQMIKGELVLTARAGHKAHLMKDGEGAWKKDPKDGGKPLGLKKL